MPINAARPSIGDKVNEAYEFQSWVADLLVVSGYLEGQIFSTGLSKGATYQYYAALERQKIRYTSPDVLVMNRWLSGPKVEFRFGLACSRSNTGFELNGSSCVAIPEYQRDDILRIIKENELKVFLIFGRKINDEEFAVGVINPAEEPFDRFLFMDQLTGKPRYRATAYRTRGLMRWSEFVETRRKSGDPEPDLEYLNQYRVPWLGDEWK